MKWWERRHRPETKVRACTPRYYSYCTEVGGANGISPAHLLSPSLSTCTDDVPHVVGPLFRAVDETQQELFFREIERELDDINSFFRARQAALSHQLHELEEEVGMGLVATH